MELLEWSTWSIYSSTKFKEFSEILHIPEPVFYKSVIACLCHEIPQEVWGKIFIFCFISFSDLEHFFSLEYRDNSRKSD